MSLKDFLSQAALGFERTGDEATVSGFSQGFVAGLLNLSGETVKSLFAQTTPGLAAGYAMAGRLPNADKKTYLAEIRQFTGYVSVGDWTDRDKRDYVNEYAAKLRLHYLQ